MNNKQQHVYVIAEVGVNHNGNTELAYKLIDLAAKAGADAVKFQMFYPELLCSSVYRYDEMNMLNKYMVDKKTMKKFKEYALKCGLDFIVTPFDFRSLQDVIELDCAFIKIASGEVTHIPLLKKAAESNSQIILSTGAADLKDVRRAVMAIESVNKHKLALLHCTSKYPAPDNSLNLSAITTLKKEFSQCEVGYSDHSIGAVAASMAVSLGATMIEKHITLDKQLQGPDHTASADSYEFIEMVKNIRMAEKMLGNGKKEPQECEGIIGRSIVFAKDMVEGDIILEEHIEYKRPGMGIRPYEADKIIGNRINKNVKKDELVKWEDII